MATTAERVRRIAFRVTELVLFCFGLALVIPPVPSDDSQTYRLFPGLLIGSVVFGGALLLGIWRGAENWATAAIKLLFYLGFAAVVHERVFGF